MPGPRRPVSRAGGSMIPGVMVEFLGRASVAVAATRDGKLVPRIHYLSGWYVEDNGEIVVALVGEDFTFGLMESLEDNGRFAMTAEVIGPHETYQFKGTWEGCRPPVEADLRIHEACRRRFLEAIQRCYPGHFTDEAVGARFETPALAVRFRVREIYVQTPGPAAGRRLFPRRTK